MPICFVKNLTPASWIMPPGIRLSQWRRWNCTALQVRKNTSTWPNFFLDARGKGNEYSQDHKKIINQTEAVGHAVRAAYMFSGTANVAAITGDKTYLNAIDKIREDIIEDKFYLTGGTR